MARETHFQASHERYVRKHHGTLGWWSYRAAVLTGAAARTIVLTGRTDARTAALRLRLLRTGPLRAEAALGRSGLRVAHVVVDRRLRRGRALRLPGGQRAGRPGPPGRRHRRRTRTGCGPNSTTP